MGEIGFIIGDMRFISLHGKEIATVFVDLARLRISVFKEYPYLYEGSMDYETDYLRTYSQSERAFLLGVYDGNKMVGATTCIPLSDETAELKTPFEKNGLDVSRIFYFGESILSPSYRGMGLGHRFFDEREKHALGFGAYSTTCFCSVVRADDHPSRPDDYRPKDGFWKKRGYRKNPGMIAEMGWLDIGEAESTAKPMVFWTKDW